MKGWRIAIVVLLIAILIEFSMLQSPRQEEAWEPPQQQEETLETSQDSWQQVQQQEIPEPTQEQKAVESAENQTENQTENQAEDYIESKVDYASYLVITASPHIIVDSCGRRYIVGSFKNTASVELDSVTLSFRLYDKDGNQIGEAGTVIDNLLPGKTWKYTARIWENEASYFEFAEINVYIDEK